MPIKAYWLCLPRQHPVISRRAQGTAINRMHHMRTLRTQNKAPEACRPLPRTFPTLSAPAEESPVLFCPGPQKRIAVQTMHLAQLQCLAIHARGLVICCSHHFIACRRTTLCADVLAGRCICQLAMRPAADVTVVMLIR